ncbi:NifB/NifX family molybdenum-iron cluster-binding protein [Fervidobacterium nodosum]|uniref:Dinitrogenase iron-molybdenum cofactor biosynthesis protein n=1 Tax=Fervidobacterium nodosum (strain ATCC 35602 / DSM 5306 / Rt17-B1) TaxID=381764 RepID=A7HN07_FERNB|nr:NifB/NifX family molybdenum-iron cluster-binding protein [Fervidobacterium nodosum]ABS61290.1 Dinitrogenase iron-molybdenum cofactor biosynthesis protein [Fervidobacterium nodosum Rt17-B1]PHJ14392.1 dinitrogenase iron-molybdenum cofactor biosynthesis protein [Fervidobacterium sp. SC_NGM5_G05]
MVRIAIPTDDGKTVASHFGRAEYFVIVEIEGDKELSRKLSENLHARGHHGGEHNHHGYGRHFGRLHNEYEHEHEQEHGHHHGHDEVFASTGDVDGVIAVKMGPHMFEDIKARKIGVYLVPLNTTIDDAVKLFLEGKLKNIVR